jgi:hypothetical protein
MELRNIFCADRWPRFSASTLSFCQQVALMMKNTRFETPVAVVVGLGLRCQIGSLDEIHRFLTEWTTSRRGYLHAAALETCEAVRTGELSVDDARKAFIDFAKASHILYLELDEPAIAKGADQARSAVSARLN